MAYKQKGWSPFTASNKLKKAKSEMKAHKDAYASLDTSNPYANMENKFEDLTISQKQALFEKQKDMQIQANTLDTARKSSGSSGTAAVAQALANQGKKSSQKSSTSVGAQERQNQLLAKQEAARLQLKERQGEILSRKMKKDKTSTLLGMSQQEVAAQREKKPAAKQAKADVLASGVNSAGSMVTGGGWAPFTQADTGIIENIKNPRGESHDTRYYRDARYRKRYDKKQSKQRGRQKAKEARIDRRN